MAMFVPTGTSTAVDPCDVLFIAPRTVGVNAYATLYVATGAPILVDAAPAALGVELDEAEFGEGSGFTLFTGAVAMTGLGECLVAGAQVRSVVPSPDELGSTWRLALAETQLFAPATTLSEALDLINDCTACGGGGGGGGYVEHNETDDLTVTGTGLNANKSSSAWVRLGDGSDASPGDVVQVEFLGSINSAGDVPIRFNLTLPFPVDTDYGVTISGVNIAQIAGTAVPEFTGLGLLSYGPGNTSVNFDAPAGVTTGGVAAWNVGLHLCYRVPGE